MNSLHTNLVVGQCHWDYLIPIIAIRKCYQIKSKSKSQFSYHKEHKLQYDIEKWKQTGKIFAKELDFTGNPYTDSNLAYRMIKKKIILLLMVSIFIRTYHKDLYG